MPCIRHYATDVSIVLALVRAGHAVALPPDLLEAHRDPAIAVRDVLGPPPSRRILTAVRKSSLRRPGAAELRAALLEQYGLRRGGGAFA